MMLGLFHGKLEILWSVMTKLKQYFLPNVGKWPSSPNFKLPQECTFVIARYLHHLLVCGLIQQLPGHVVYETQALVLEIGIQSLPAYVILELHGRLDYLSLQYIPSCHDLFIPTCIHHAIKQCFLQLNNFEQCHRPPDIVGNGEEINQYVHGDEPL
jgi:hypothetical protein